MTQQEIKENLPLLPLLMGDGSTIYCAGMHVLDCYSRDYSNNVDEAMQYAITHSINNTYGKGINPESVSEMYNVLRMLRGYLADKVDKEVLDSISKIIENATL
jgi:hypothetical protein